MGTARPSAGPTAPASAAVVPGPRNPAAFGIVHVAKFHVQSPSAKFFFAALSTPVKTLAFDIRLAAGDYEEH